MEQKRNTIMYRNREKYTAKTCGNFLRTQSLGLIWKTHIIRYDTVARQNFASKGSPRPAPKIVLKNAWQVEHGKQSSSEQSCAEGDLFKMVLRVQGVPQTTVLEDQGKMTEIRDLVNTLRTACPTESVIADLSNPGKFNRFSDES